MLILTPRGSRVPGYTVVSSTELSALGDGCAHELVYWGDISFPPSEMPAPGAQVFLLFVPGASQWLGT